MTRRRIWTAFGTIGLALAATAVLVGAWPAPAVGAGGGWRVCTPASWLRGRDAR